MATHKKSIVLHPKKIGLFFIAISLLLFSVYIALLFFDPTFSADTTYTFAGLFNMNAEVSIPTWYSQSILSVAAAIALCIAYVDETKKRLPWLGLAIIFVFLSIDEGASVHELTAVPLRELFGIQAGFFYYSWILLYGLFLTLFAILYARFWWNLPKRTKITLLLSGVIYLSGAVGIEMMGAEAASTGESSGRYYSMLVAFEEVFEMIGISIYIYALLDYFKLKQTTLTIE